MINTENKGRRDLRDALYWTSLAAAKNRPRYVGSVLTYFTNQILDFSISSGVAETYFHQIIKATKQIWLQRCEDSSL